MTDSTLMYSSLTDTLRRHAVRFGIAPATEYTNGWQIYVDHQLHDVNLENRFADADTSFERQGGLGVQAVHGRNITTAIRVVEALEPYAVHPLGQYASTRIGPSDIPGYVSVISFTPLVDDDELHMVCHQLAMAIRHESSNPMVEVTDLSEHFLDAERHEHAMRAAMDLDR